MEINIQTVEDGGIRGVYPENTRVIAYHNYLFLYDGETLTWIFANDIMGGGVIHPMDVSNRERTKIHCFISSKGNNMTAPSGIMTTESNGMDSTSSAFRTVGRFEHPDLGVIHMKELDESIKFADTKTCVFIGQCVTNEFHSRKASLFLYDGRIFGLHDSYGIHRLDASVMVGESPIVTGWSKPATQNFCVIDTTGKLTTLVLNHGKLEAKAHVEQPYILPVAPSEPFGICSSYRCPEKNVFGFIREFPIYSAQLGELFVTSNGRIQVSGRNHEFVLYPRPSRLAEIGCFYLGGPDVLCIISQDSADDPTKTIRFIEDITGNRLIEETFCDTQFNLGQKLFKHESSKESTIHTSDGQSVRVHRTVMSLEENSVFQHMEWNEKGESDLFKSNGIDESVAKKLVRYVYLREVDIYDGDKYASDDYSFPAMIVNFTHVIGLIHGANVCGLPILRKRIVRELVDNDVVWSMTPDQAKRIAEICDEIRSHALSRIHGLDAHPYHKEDTEKRKNYHGEVVMIFEEDDDSDTYRE